MNKAVIGFFDRTFYKEYPSNWDNKLFRERILEKITPDTLLLDLGAGSGYVQEMDFRAHAEKVTGIDLDEAVARNPFLHDYVHGSVYDLSVFPPDHFDLIICNSVVEHIDKPEIFISELSRVLKPGGWFMAKTPNRNHYMPLIARITPLSFHKWINKRRGRPEEHTFPTYYRLNSRKKIRKLFSAAGFDPVIIETFEGPPSYLRMNFIFYTIGWIYERLLNVFRADEFKMVLIFSARKKVQP
jgi:SAM-dependent methyltransferase